MKFREARPSDGPAIRTVARASLQASYSLSPGAIESAVDSWYDDESIREKADDDTDLLLVGEDEGEIVGFSESVVVDDRGEIAWLHVAPAHRGRGIGGKLFERTREALDERGVEAIRGRVLQDNAEGNEFYERQGFSKVDESRVEMDARVHVENVYGEDPAAAGELTPIAGPEDQQLFVDETGGDRGSLGPFYAVHTDPEGATRYGFYCSNCGTLANSMDPMGRIECDTCGNRRKPTRWDAAYL